MTTLDELLEDYSRHAVPAERTVSGLRIGLILTGITITVPAFLVGIELGQGMGLVRATLAALTGGLVLFLIGSLSGTVAARTHLSTYLILQRTFGIHGGRFVSFFISLTSLGWFAVTLVLFADALSPMVSRNLGLELPGIACLLLGSLLMIATTVFGFKALDRISLAIVPLLALFLLVVAFFSLRHSGSNVLSFSSGHLGFGQGVSAVIGGYIVGMTLLPDLCRYARKKHDGVTGAFIGSFLGYPMVLVLSALPSIATSMQDYIAILGVLGLGGFGAIMIVLATWTTNANNLYSGSLAISSIVTSIAKWKLVVVIGICGTLLALAGLAENLIAFLLLLGYLVPPVAGIYIVDYFLINRDDSLYQQEPGRGFRIAAFLAWLAGSAVGYMTTNAFFSLSSIPSVDTIVVASISFYIFSVLFEKKRI